MLKKNTDQYLIDPDKKFKLDKAATKPPKGCGKDKQFRKQLIDVVADISQLQRKLYADNRYSLLLLFQAMDAAGKDSTIRNILKGVNPAGCQVFSFKQPSKEELDHDFLWRSAIRLPERGRIGVFNRSYYEEVLVVKVHPEYLGSQNLPGETNTQNFWQQRYDSINDHEKHLARNGTVILKFWLNVSKEEQAKRFLSRLDESEKNWKFSAGDLKERERWDDYMDAYETMLNATSTDSAPWYGIPADNKPWMRLKIAEIIASKLQQLDINYPTSELSDGDKITEFKNQLNN